MSPSTSILSVRNNELLQHELFGFGLIFHENAIYRKMSRYIVKYITSNDEMLYIKKNLLVIPNNEEATVETKLFENFL